MLFGDQRKDYREIFFSAWEKHKISSELSALEKQVVSILLKHPEYQSIFAGREKNFQRDFFEELGETNPFLHLSLHLVTLEQISTDSPSGIVKLFKDAANVFADVHEAEHCIMNAIALGLNDALKNNKEFDEKRYFKRIKKAIRDGRW